MEAELQMNCKWCCQILLETKIIRLYVLIGHTSERVINLRGKLRSDKCHDFL